MAKLPPPDPADAPNATQPSNFNGHQPNSAARSNGAAVGASYIFNEGFFGLALTQNNALYHIPGIDGEDHDTRIDAHQTKLMSKGEWRSPSPVVDAVRFWGGLTDYKHNELGLADDTNPASDGIRQTFTNKEQEGRVETQLAPSKSEARRKITEQGGSFNYGPDRTKVTDVKAAVPVTDGLVVRLGRKIFRVRLS